MEEYTVFYHTLTSHKCPKTGKEHSYYSPHRCFRCDTQLCKVGSISGYPFRTPNLAVSTTAPVYAQKLIHRKSMDKIKPGWQRPLLFFQVLTLARNARIAFSNTVRKSASIKQTNILGETPWQPDEFWHGAIALPVPWRTADRSTSVNAQNFYRARHILVNLVGFTCVRPVLTPHSVAWPKRIRKQ